MRIVFDTCQDKPHRCPRCYTVTDPDLRAGRAVVRCCWCGTLFTRHSRIARLLPYRGIVCEQPHRHPDALRAADRLRAAEGLLERVAHLYEDVDRVLGMPKEEFSAWEAEKRLWREDYTAYIEVGAHGTLDPKGG